MIIDRLLWLGRLTWGLVFGFPGEFVWMALSTVTQMIVWGWVLNAVSSGTLGSVEIYNEALVGDLFGHASTVWALGLLVASAAYLLCPAIVFLVKGFDNGVVETLGHLRDMGMAVNGFGTGLGISCLGLMLIEPVSPGIVVGVWLVVALLLTVPALSFAGHFLGIASEFRRSGLWNAVCGFLNSR